MPATAFLGKPAVDGTVFEALLLYFGRLARRETQERK
jgi:hypothetical protein